MAKLLVTYVFCVFVVFNIMLVYMIWYLKKHHESIHDQLGKPGLITSPKKYFQVFAFLFEKDPSTDLTLKTLKMSFTVFFVMSLLTFLVLSSVAIYVSTS